MAKKKTEGKTAMAAIVKLDRAGLLKELASLQKEFYILEMKHAAGELKETHKLRLESKKIARVQTQLNAI